MSISINCLNVRLFKGLSTQVRKFCLRNNHQMSYFHQLTVVKHGLLLSLKFTSGHSQVNIVMPLLIFLVIALLYSGELV